MQVLVQAAKVRRSNESSAYGDTVSLPTTKGVIYGVARRSARFEDQGS